MSQPRKWNWPAVLAVFVGGGVLCAVPTTMLAQSKDEAKPKEEVKDDTKSTVSFETVDDVKLSGTFYRGLRGSESPVAILVHRFGSDRTKGGWDALARKLQNDLNFAVLTFDLRGHGQSTVVKDKFWDHAHNKNGLKGGFREKTKSSVTVADFKSSYWPILFNDLVAARYYVDIENDAQKCNSSTIVVIAAQESAGLAMGWLANEYDRRAIGGGAGALVTGGTLRYPGEDVAAGIWLGPVGRASGMSFKPTEWFAKPNSNRLRENTSMYFIYGKQDAPSASVVPGYLAAVKKPPEGKNSKPLNFDKEEALATKLPGQDLLGNATLNVNDKIAEYLKALLEKRGNQPWKQQNPGPMQLFPINAWGYLQPN